jgi:hypothetical protein
MDPLGLALETFDGVGAARTQENGAAIDTSGSLDGKAFKAAEGLGQALHDHPQTPRCLVSKLYRTAVGRDTLDEERPYLAFLNQSFQSNGFRVPELMRAIALSRNFYAIAKPQAATTKVAANGGRS